MSARTITHNGLTLTISEWAARSTLSAATLRARLNAGWSIDAALNAPMYSSGRKHSAATAKQAQREFSKLVRDIDRALRDFKARMDWLLDDTTPGVVANFAEMPNDRATRTAQDRA